MKKIVFAILFFLVMMLPSCVKADSLCTYNYQSLMKKKASNVMPSYTYTENNDKVTFDITLTNMQPDLYLVVVVNSKTNQAKNYYYSGSTEMVLKGYNPGDKIKFQIRTNNSICDTSVLSTKYVNLPYYNKYYKDSLCEGKENYSVCYKWNQENMTQEEFEKRVKELYNEQPKEEKETTNEPNVFDKIYSFLHDFYIYILVGIGLIMLLVMYLKHKKNDVGF